MGSFAFTCAISGLPIEAGDSIRVLLLTQNPIQDDDMYGHWFPRTLPLKGDYNNYGSVKNVPEGPAQNLWREGLQIDLIEKDSNGDVLLSKNMTFHQLLAALRENRVFVLRETRFWERSRETVKDLPIEAQKLVDDFLKKNIPEPTPVSEKNPLPVGLTMIREDVWQAILTCKIGARDGRNRMINFAEVRSRVILSYSQELSEGIYNTQWMFGRGVPFTIGIGDHIQLMAEKGALTEDFMTEIAEFMFVQSVLADTRYQWRISAQGGLQFGDWNQHVALLSAMTNVAKTIAKEKAAEE